MHTAKLTLIGKAMSSGLMRECLPWQLYCYCVANANETPTTVAVNAGRRIVEVGAAPGEFITTLAALGDALKTDRYKVRQTLTVLTCAPWNCIRTTTGDCTTITVIGLAKLMSADPTPPSAVDNQPTVVNPPRRPPVAYVAPVLDDIGEDAKRLGQIFCAVFKEIKGRNLPPTVRPYADLLLQGALATHNAEQLETDLLDLPNHVHCKGIPRLRDPRELMNLGVDFFDSLRDGLERAKMERSNRKPEAHVGDTRKKDYAL